MSITRRLTGALAVASLLALLAGACSGSAEDTAEPGASDASSTDAANPDGDSLDASAWKDASPGDGGVAIDAAPDAGGPRCPPKFAPPGQSRCTRSTDQIDCQHNDASLSGRLVVWQSPIGTPPPEGWPVVVVFHGTAFGPALTWSGSTALPFNGFHQIALQAMLLDNGFTVVAPEADGVAWATNFPGYELSSDYQFIFDLLDAIASGAFGPANTQRLYATGISSGGYMTSRMAVSYPGRFKALAINSGSYATCSSLLCNIPASLPKDHPPTLFLHGQNDITVPLITAQAYRDRLKSHGIETRFVVDPNLGHAWLPAAPEEATCWFLSH